MKKSIKRIIKKSPLQAKTSSTAKVVVVDTSVWDNMRRVSHEGGPGAIEILKKFKELIDSGHIVLKLPEQIKKEFMRHQLEAIEGSNKWGQIIGDGEDLRKKLMDKYKLTSSDLNRKAARDAISSCDKTRTHLEHLSKAIHQEKRKNQEEASRLIKTLLRNLNPIKADDAIMVAAWHRYLKGDPPTRRSEGESGGDAIIWETILSKCADKDLIIVTDDQGWFSQSSKNNCEPNPVLSRDWKRRTTKARLTLYRSLSALITSVKGKKAISQSAIKEEKTATVSNANTVGLMRQIMFGPQDDAVMAAFDGTGTKMPQCTMCGKELEYMPLYYAGRLNLIRVNTLQFTQRTNDCCKKCNDEYALSGRHILDICHVCRRDFYREAPSLLSSTVFETSFNRETCPLCQKTQSDTNSLFKI